MATGNQTSIGRIQARRGKFGYCERINRERATTNRGDEARADGPDRSLQAEQDIAEALEYYLDEGSPSSAERFMDAVELAYPEIRKAPFRFPADHDGIRQKPIAGFPFSVLYSIQDEEIVVFSIRHHKRKPGFWRNRL